jgi:intein/homing endonuclease
MFDYLGRIYPNETSKKSGLIKILPSVISDKSRIPKTLFDLNQAIPDRFKADGSPMRYIDLTTEGWQELAVEELGGYYYDVY